MISELIGSLQWLIGFLPYYSTCPSNVVKLVHYHLPWKTYVRESRLNGLSWALFVTEQDFELNELPLESESIRSTNREGKSILFQLAAIYRWVSPKEALETFGYTESDTSISTHLRKLSREVVTNFYMDELVHKGEVVSKLVKRRFNRKFQGIVRLVELDLGAFSEVTPRQFVIEGFNLAAPEQD